MFAPANPEIERIRAQAILRSFTEYNEAVTLFTPDERHCDQDETLNSQPKSVSSRGFSKQSS